MSEKNHISRRTALKSIGVTAATGAAAMTTGVAAVANAKSTKTESWDLDPNKPGDAIRAYAKITGSTAKERVYLQYYGDIFSVIPGQDQQPLFRLKGLVRLDWTPNDDGTYSHVNYDQGLFCDYETGEVMNSYKNPFTGEINTPLHYKSGPLASTIGTGKSHTNPLKRDWRITGNQITVSGARANSFENPVSPEKFGQASTGERVHYSTISTYIADLDKVTDPSIDAVDTDHTWTFITNYPAWMMVGDMPGNVVWQWVAHKFSDPEKIDPYIKQQVEKLSPDFFTDKKPWPLRSDGWTQYSRERKPT